MNIKDMRPSSNIEDARNPDKGDYGVGAPKSDFGLGPDMDTDFNETVVRKPNNPDGVNQHTYRHRPSPPKYKYGWDKPS